MQFDLEEGRSAVEDLQENDTRISNHIESQVKAQFRTLNNSKTRLKVALKDGQRIAGGRQKRETVELSCSTITW